MILELNGIYKNYMTDNFEVPVLKNINIEVEEGDYIAIMGPSGSGKSTLMNIIGCLDKPTSGRYLFDGIDISVQKDNALSDIRNRGIGFVFQNFNLLPRQTAIENVELPLIYANMRKRKRKQIAKEALEKVGLGDRINFLPTQLSGGQKQRVAIARAIANRPKILLADEPTGALDSVSGKQVMELFSKLNSEGMTIVMITHERSIADCAKKIIAIYDGEIISIEKLDELTSSGKYGSGGGENEQL